MKQPITRDVVIHSTAGLPSFPVIVLEILELINDPSCDLYDVAKLIERDPVIAARVISLANNVFNKTQNNSKARDIYTATSLIGMSRVQELTLVSKIAQFISNKHQNDISSGYWLHSVAVAITAQEVAIETKLPIAPAISLVAGLLHDIGQLWLYRYHLDVYESLLRRVSIRQTTIDIEEHEEFGVTHGEIGGWLAEHWKLPPNIRDAICHHHHPELALNEPLVPTISIAEVVANALDLGGRKENRVTNLSSEACEAINFQVTDDIQALLGRIDARFKHATTSFGYQATTNLMKSSTTKLRSQLTVSVLLVLVLLWSAATYEVSRTYDTLIREAEVKTLVQSQVFAEYSRSTIKRINEFALDLRAEWKGNWQDFSQTVQRRQENIDDLTFQVAIIDRNGFLAYSNLAKPDERTDLSEREHFKFHKESPLADRLFISKPLKGKVSGRWSIQATRPILRNGKFDGVIVISIGPDQFASFAKNLQLGALGTLTVCRQSGEVMARYPSDENTLGRTLKNRVFLDQTTPDKGNYRATSDIDGYERIFGYYRIPEYGLIFVQGEAIRELMIPYEEHRQNVFLAAVVVTAVAIALFFFLLRSLTSLERARAQLDAIFSLSPDGFVSFDREYCVSYVSPSVSRLTNIDRNQLFGLHETLFSQVIQKRCDAGSADFVPFEVRTMREIQGKDERLSKNRQILELTIPSKRYLEVRIRLSESESVSHILYFRDVTHETEVDRMKSEFLSIAAHELRTPMSIIYGYCELLLDDEYPTEQLKEMLSTVHEQADLMISIVNELLDLARIQERQGKDFIFKKVELNALLLQNIAQFNPPVGRPSPAVSYLEEPCWINVDARKIEQALNQVIDNAYKYSQVNEDVEIELKLSVNAAEQMEVGIRIKDRGMGMTPSQLSRVFERFYRADTSGKIPGTGLGMSLVKEIIELHRGHVTLESETNVGTQVTLWLPREEFEEQPRLPV